MSDYMAGYLIGVGVVIVVAIVVALAFKKYRNKPCQYDERQMQVRGRGYQISFMTVLLLNMLYGLFLFGLTKDLVSPQLVVMTIAFIGIMVYCVYCIFNDAYLQVGQNYGYGKWAALTLLVIIINGIAAFINRGEGLTMEGFATGFSMNLMIALTFLVVLVSVIIKSIIDKRRTAGEES